MQGIRGAITAVSYTHLDVYKRQLLPYAQGKKSLPKAVIGMTDITARPIVPAETLSFTVPFEMFQEMEKNSAGSFLDKEDWGKIAKRI